MEIAETLSGALKYCEIVNDFFANFTLAFAEGSEELGAGLSHISQTTRAAAFSYVQRGQGHFI